jgi:hypothetical protein
MLVIFSLAVILCSVFIGAVNDAYGTGADTSWKDTYDKMSEASSLSEEIKEEAEPSGDEGIISFTGGLILKGTISIFKLIIDSFSTFASIVSNLLEDLGVPDSIANPLGNGVIVIFVSTIIFAIISAVLKRKL